MSLLRFVVVALVEVLFTVTRWVMVDEAELIKIPSVVVRGVRYVPASVQLDELPPTQAPLIAKHPVLKFTPFENVEVPAPPIFITPEV